MTTLEKPELERWQKIKAFSLYYLNAHILKPFSELLHDDWFKMLGEKYSVLAAPRGFAKSHIFSFFYPLYALLMEGAKDILLVGSSESKTARWVRKIAYELENNPLIIEHFGQQKRQGGKWTTTELELANGSSLLGIGVGANIRGYRPDILLPDDIEDSEHVLSEDQRAKIWEWFWTDALYTLKPTGQIALIGTIEHPLSLINTMLNDEHLSKSWAQKKYQALITDEAGNEQSVWPEQWSTAHLVAEREMNPIAFEQERMNNPVPDSLRPFHDEDIIYYDKLPKGLSYTTTMDPAIATGPKNDFTAIVTVGTDEHGHMYLAEITKKRMLPDETIRELFNHIIEWEPHTVGLETTGFQKMLKIAFELEAKKRHLYPNIKELSWDKSKLGTKKEYRIQALQPLYKRGMIHHARNMKDLRIELLSFPAGRHDDVLDALAYHLDLIEPHKAPKRRDIRPDTYAAFEAKIKGNDRRSIKWHE